MSGSSDPAIPRPPAGTRAAGRRLWDSIVAKFDLDEHELALLRQMVRTVDVLDELDAAVRRDGPLIDSSAGPRAHPAVIEGRQQRIALARLTAALRLPQGEDGDRQAGARPQRRVGARGVYGIRGAVS
jgi:hypothetical protein